MNKTILMICYYYPPLTDVGCKRSVAFSRYFKKYGLNPYVLSVKNPDTTYCSLGKDKPPSEIPVQYTYSVLNGYKFFGKLNGLLSRFAGLFGKEIKRNYFYDIFCIPDIFCGWIPFTVIKGIWAIREHNIDIIYVSCPPFSSGIIGVLLKLITKKPLILDFRDPFAVERLRFFRLPGFTQKIKRRIEKWFVKKTDILVVTTEITKKSYIAQYPQVRDKIFAVHNGFDTEHFPLKSSLKYPKFTITYAGLYFYDIYEWDAEFFFEALSILKKKEKINKNNFQFLFYGEGKDQINQIARACGVEDIVIANSRVPYKKIVDIISRSHLQLLRNRELVIPSKLYDGIAFNVPFLATIPNGEAEQIIKKYSPSSYVVTRQSAKEVAAAILDAIEKYKKHEIKDNLVKEFMELFSREFLTIKLMKIITRCLKKT